MKTTTLNKIRACSPCEAGWQKLIAHLGKTKADDEPLPFSVILESNGLDDALWCCRAAPEYDKEWRLFAAWCARQVAPLNPDTRVMAAIIARDQLISARAAALDAAVAAARAAAAAGAAVWDAAEAARAAQKTEFSRIINN